MSTWTPWLHIPVHQEQDKSVHPNPLCWHSPNPTRVFVAPKRSSAPSLASNTASRDCWLRAYWSLGARCRWDEGQGSPLWKHVGRWPRPERWAPRFWSKAPAITELRFCASNLSLINIQLCQYLYTELNVSLVLQKSRAARLGTWRETVANTKTEPQD